MRIIKIVFKINVFSTYVKCYLKSHRSFYTSSVIFILEPLFIFFILKQQL